MSIKKILITLMDKFKRKQKLLTSNLEEKQKHDDLSKLWIESLEFKIDPQSLKNKNSLEDCILEYINQYIKQVNEGTIKDISYKAFTRMFDESNDEIGKNNEYQQKLKDKINKTKKYRLDEQYQSKGDPIFYQIFKEDLDENEFDNKNANLCTIYLNCERKNIARLTGEILKKLDKVKDCNFKMKFLAESSESSITKRYQRNDKIILYTDNAIDKDRIISCITDLRQEKQNLFSNEKQLPLMPKVNGFIGCVQQGENSVTTPLCENKYADTYNSKLSIIMEDCLTYGLKKIMTENPNLEIEINSDYNDNPKQYLKALKRMRPEQISQLITIMKNELINCCEKSNIEIDKSITDQKNKENLRDAF